MKKWKIKPKHSIKLKKRVEEFIDKNPAAIKKISPVDIRNMFEDLQIYQTELEQYSHELGRSHKRLQESEEKYRHLAEGTFEAVVWHDKGKIIEANEQYYKMFGYKPEELAGKDAIVLTATPDSVKFMREQISLGHLGPYEVVGMKQDGTEFPMEIRVKIMKTKGKIARMAAIRDLTDRKQAEGEREKLVSELQEALKEIKTLRGILPFCSFCKKIRDDKGYWEKVDVYIHKHSQADISHGVCPDCADEHYPDLNLYDD